MDKRVLFSPTPAEGPNELGGHHAWSPVGSRLAAWTTDKYREPFPSGRNWFYEGRLILTGPPDWQVHPVTPPGVTWSSVEWSPNGKNVGVVWRDPDDVSLRKVLLIDAASGKKRELASGLFGDLAWSGDGRYLAVTCVSLPERRDHWAEETVEETVGVRIFEIATGRAVSNIPGAVAMAWLDNTGMVSSWWRY